MVLSLRPVDQASVREFVSWRYQPPYDIYDLADPPDAEALRFFLDPRNGYYALRDEAEELVAFCCFGLDAQVPGGDYSADALDIGLGVRPDLTGKGRGLTFVKAVLDFARRAFAPIEFRVTIAQFNARALRIWRNAGFRRAQTFRSTADGRPFVILSRPASEA